MIAAAGELGADVVPTLAAEAHTTWRDDVLARIGASLPVDAVALALHGADTAEGMDGLEGHLCPVYTRGRIDDGGQQRLGCETKGIVGYAALVAEGGCAVPDVLYNSARTPPGSAGAAWRMRVSLAGASRTVVGPARRP